MKFVLPDPISFVADLVTLFGIPALAYATYQLYKNAKRAREPQAVSHGCLEFYDIENEVGINLVPLDTVVAIPREGDSVLLPGDMDHGYLGGGDYDVLSVEFTFVPPLHGEVDQPCPALPGKIIVVVRKRK
jgi:hypothetical protein